MKSEEMLWFLCCNVDNWQKTDMLCTNRSLACFLDPLVTKCFLAHYKLFVIYLFLFEDQHQQKNSPFIRRNTACLASFVLLANWSFIVKSFPYIQRAMSVIAVIREQWMLSSMKSILLPCAAKEKNDGNFTLSFWS